MKTYDPDDDDQMDEADQAEMRQVFDYLQATKTPTDLQKFFAQTVVEVNPDVTYDEIMDKMASPPEEA